MGFNIAFKADGTFESQFFSGTQTLAPGASGDMVILTPPPGQKVRLETLSTSSGAEAGVSISVNGVSVVTSLSLESNISAVLGQFTVGRSGSSVLSAMPGATVGITGGTDEELKIIKDTGSTAVAIVYGYHFGV